MMTKFSSLLTGALAFILLATGSLTNGLAAEPAAWHAAKAPLMTRWASQVGPNNALPEYPRPQMVRSNWLNLNGLWNYAITPDSVSAMPPAAGKILVPFPLESALSGVMTNLDEKSKLWYHRTFAVPETWRGRRVRLHFGAVDWQCNLWINGHEIGLHRGGYDAFTFDVTEDIRWKGSEEITICVTDATEGDQPRGKQSRKPDGIFYTPTSGIWQTVWIEPVSDVCIDSLKIIPDVDNKLIRLKVTVNDLSDTIKVSAKAMIGGREVGSVTGSANSELLLNLGAPHLWSPNDPFLYTLEVKLADGSAEVDSVSSYFGMRKIALRKDDQGFARIALNDQFIFQIGTLDQGFWPDGIYTAPTDEALRSDIEFLKSLGFNLTRKHVKVEPDRWYYWCDKLGLLVWQDMPSGNNDTPHARRGFENELLRMIEGLGNHPSIVVWTLFNEGWGQYDTEALVQWIKKFDPTRLVNGASGWTDMHVGDLIDMHSYPGPDAPIPEAHRATVTGEFGGYGLVISNNCWSTHCWGYQMLSDENELAARYTKALRLVWELHRLSGLSAAVYTQTADVETECNGLMTYDRAVTKIPPDKVRAANLGVDSGPPMKVILADALFGRAKWKYVTEEPKQDWNNRNFDPARWLEGVGGFGTTGTPGIFVGTVWDTPDIWLRNEFNLDLQDVSSLKFQVFHDEDAEIYLNGILAAKLTGFVTDYDEVPVSPEAIASLKSGRNTIAVHCHQTKGGQGIDVGILCLLKSK